MHKTANRGRAGAQATRRLAAQQIVSDHVEDGSLRFRDVLEAIRLSSPRSKTGVQADYVTVDGAVKAVVRALDKEEDPGRFVGRLFELYTALDGRETPGTLPTYRPTGDDPLYPNADTLQFKVSLPRIDALWQNVEVAATFFVQGGNVGAIRRAPWRERADNGLSKYLEWLSTPTHHGAVTLELDSYHGYHNHDMMDMCIASSAVVAFDDPQETFPGRVFLIKSAAMAVRASGLFSSVESDGIMKQTFVDRA